MPSHCGLPAGLGIVVPTIIGVIFLILILWMINLFWPELIQLNRDNSAFTIYG